MAAIVPLFKDVSRPDVPEPHQFRQNSKSQFARHIQAKIHVLSGKFDRNELRVLGGTGDLLAAGPLSELLFVFLENSISEKRRGFPPNETFVKKLIDAATADQLLYAPRLGLTNFNSELSRGARLLLISTLDRVLREERYRDFRTPSVCEGIADALYEQGKELIHITTAITPQNPAFDEEMKRFCYNALGVRALDMYQVPGTLDYYLYEKSNRHPLPAPVDQYMPANDCF